MITLSIRIDCGYKDSLSSEIIFHGWVAGWLDQVGIRLTHFSTELRVDAEHSQKMLNTVGGPPPR